MIGMKKAIIRILAAAIIVTSANIPVVCSAHWADEALRILSGKQIIDAVNPDEDMTRAAFAQCIDNVMDIDIKGENRFSDVPEDAPYKNAIVNLSRAQIISGVDENHFEPEGCLTREAAAAVIIRAYEYINPSPVVVSSGKKFNDEQDISLWAEDAIKKAAGLGLLHGDENNNIMPKSKLTNGEAGQLILNFMFAINCAGVSTDVKTVTIEQIKRGNIFFVDEKKEFKIISENAFIELSVVDYWNEEVARWTTTLDGSAVVEAPVDIPGYYELFVYANNQAGQKIQLAKTAFAVLTPYNFDRIMPEESDFGICCHLNRRNKGWQRDLVNEVSWMGAKIIRDDLDWGTNEREMGTYIIDVEPQRTLMEEKNIGFLHASGGANRFYDEGSTPYTAAGQLGAANYISAMAGLFGKNYIAVDVFNEFWLPFFGDIGTGPADSKPEYYVPLQKKVYEVMKERASGCDCYFELRRRCRENPWLV